MEYTVDMVYIVDMVYTVNMMWGMRGMREIRETCLLYTSPSPRD